METIAEALLALRDIQREVVFSYLWDTVEFEYKGAITEIDDYGNPVYGAAQKRTYGGSTDIPARIDTSRAFRPAGLPEQSQVVDEYNLYVPWDFEFDPDDIIITTDGTRLEIRKTATLSDGDVTREMTVSEISGDG